MFAVILGDKSDFELRSLHIQKLYLFWYTKSGSAK